MKNNKGFTLIELLIVIAIISVLTVLGFTNYITSQKRGRDARRMQDLEQVKAALEVYKLDTGKYPYNALGALPSSTTDFKGNFASMNTTLYLNYLKSTFTDPSRGTYSYEYYASVDGNTYQLCAFLEKPNSPTSCPISAGTPSGNYGFSNP